LRHTYAIKRMLTALTGIDRHESIFAALEEAPAKGGIAGFDHRKADISSGVKIIEDPTPTAKRTPRAFFFRPRASSLRPW